MNQVHSLPARSGGGGTGDPCSAYHMQPTTIEEDAWDKVYGMDAFKEHLMDTYVMPILYPKLFDAKSTQNILLFGPPGTGKTFVARAIAGQIQSELMRSHQAQEVVFFVPQKNDLGSKYASEAGQKITCMFQNSEKRQPALSMIFVDEIEDLVKDRADSHPSSVTNSDSVTAFLQVLDGAIAYSHVYFVAATNYPWKLDSAFLSRVKPIFMDVPSAAGIHQIVAQTIYDVVQPDTKNPLLDHVEYTRQLTLWAAQFVEVILPRPALLHDVQMELCRKEYAQEDMYHSLIMDYIVNSRHFSESGWSNTGLAMRTIRRLIGDWKSWNGLQVVRRHAMLRRQEPLYLEDIQPPRAFFADPRACKKFSYPALDLTGYVDLIEYSLTSNPPRERSVARQKCKPNVMKAQLYPFLNLSYFNQQPEEFHLHQLVGNDVVFTGISGNTLTIPLLRVPVPMDDL
jgi:ATPase family associated with various cellular activities (AAA)